MKKSHAGCSSPAVCRPASQDYLDEDTALVGVPLDCTGTDPGLQRYYFVLISRDPAAGAPEEAAVPYIPAQGSVARHTQVPATLPFRYPEPDPAPVMTLTPNPDPTLTFARADQVAAPWPAAGEGQLREVLPRVVQKPASGGEGATNRCSPQSALAPPERPAPAHALTSPAACYAQRSSPSSSPFCSGLRQPLTITTMVADLRNSA